MLTPPPLPAQGRIDLGKLKSQIAKRLGPDQAQRYFHCLNRLLANKLSKLDFQRFCLSTLGHENIPLHNQLVLSILKNACLAKAPPPLTSLKLPSGKKSPQESHGLCPSPAPALPMSVWSNGDILPPRKVRSGIRDRRIRDRPSPLGPNGKADVAAHKSLVTANEVRENGGMSPCDLKRLVEHRRDGSVEQPAKKLHADNLSPHGKGFVHSKSLVEAVTVGESEELGHGSHLSSTRGPLRAPLGIPFCSASTGGARKSSPLLSVGSSCSFSTSYDCGELLHAGDLRRRMEKIAEAQGLAGVTMDCTNLLNNGLDAYLKRLIKSGIELVRARSEHNSISCTVYNHHAHVKQINGVGPGNHNLAEGGVGSLEDSHELKNWCSMSLHDFRIAMELNPQQLGEDWPLLLEKICFHSFEE